MTKSGKTLNERAENLEYHMVRVGSCLDNIEGIMATKDDIGKLDDKLDFIIGMLDKDETERLAMRAQVGRHEDWIIRAGRNTGIRYNPGAKP